ncbi:MFS transporter [Vulcanisaeta thermophila]|uniref:MFS transporter n=1 Tax=Vulcanisaeta thermophila TaxID=867917 RepID=UPI00138945B0|nr:MFS transporter [Vulcanisaeta thermophila]
MSSGIAEEMPWTKVHTLAFTALSLGTAVEAYVYSLAYLTVNWFPMPRWLLVVFSVWPLIWLSIGALVSGPMADALGRKRSLYITWSLYVIGTSLLILSLNAATLLASLSLLLMAVGGEYNTVLVVAHEIFPRRVRSRSFYLIMNFANLGGVIASLVTVVATSPTTQRLALGLTLAVALIVIFIIRLRIPESIPWMEGKGLDATNELTRYFGDYVNRAGTWRGSNPKPSTARLPVWFRVIVGVVLSYSYVIGLSSIALTLGPYYFPSMTSWLIMAFSAASFASGFLGLWADSLSRRWLLLTSSALTTALMSTLILTSHYWRGHPWLFWTLYLLTSASMNVYWLSEDALKSEVWPTLRRGFFTALVRSLAFFLAIPTLALLAYLPLSTYLALSTALFGTSLLASAAWFVRGIETGKGVSVNAPP